jgi:hypothetical protein
MNPLAVEVSGVPFNMILTRDYLYLVNEKLNIKFRGILKNGIWNQELPFEFIYKIIHFHYVDERDIFNVCRISLTDCFDQIEFNIKIGNFMFSDRYYDLELNEYFDNFDDKIIAIHEQTEEYEEEIDTDKEGISNSKIYEANDKLKRELLITKQEFQRLKIANYIYKKKVEERFKELERAETENRRRNEAYPAPVEQVAAPVAQVAEPVMQIYEPVTLAAPAVCYLGSACRDCVPAAPVQVEPAEPAAQVEPVEQVE